MEDVPQPSRSWTLWVVLAVVGVAAIGGLVAYMASNPERPIRSAQEGLTAMYNGDHTTAQRYFTQAMNEARSPEDRATYEMLLAGSLELTSVEEAATHYLNVINTAALPAPTRGAAGVYLLMLLNAHRDAAFTKAVLARPPWPGVYQELTSDESINAEIAIAKSHEAIIETFPNFLSYLVAGEFYARKYPYLTGGIARFREEYGKKAAEYFDLGMVSLRNARDSAQWDKTRLAIGYTYAMTYAVALLDDRLGSVDEQSLRALYQEAVNFADGASAGEVIMESARFSIRLEYAKYLSAHTGPDNAGQVPVVAGELGELAASPVNRPFIAQVMSAADPSSKFGRLKAPLLFMASASPDLEKVVTSAFSH